MQRKIKSYVLRAGRVSNRQEHALSKWLSDYVISVEQKKWNLTEQFGRNADVVVEIGFGMGASLLTMATQNPHLNYLGIEVHRAGVGSLVADLHDRKLNNVRVAMHDAVEVLNECVASNSLAGVQIFFPDPWHKKRHNKRRLIQTDFVRLLTDKIRPGGFIHCATDWQDYAEHMMNILSQESGLKNCHNHQEYAPRPESRPLTKFEKRGEQLGHSVWDLIFVKI